MHPVDSSENLTPVGPQILGVGADEQVDGGELSKWKDKQMDGWVGGCKATTSERQVRHQGCKIYGGSHSQGHASTVHDSETECLAKFCTLGTSLASC